MGMGKTVGTDRRKIDGTKRTTYRIRLHGAARGARNTSSFSIVGLFGQASHLGW